MPYVDIVNEILMGSRNYYVEKRADSLTKVLNQRLCKYDRRNEDTFFSYRLAAAEQASRAREKAEGAANNKGHPMGRKRLGNADQGTGQGPSSLFILSERNIIRRTTKFLIEWVCR